MSAKAEGPAGGSEEAKPQAARVVKIEVISDNVCPWCFVGKRRMEKALAKLDPTKVSVQVHWKPFQLNPKAPSPGEDKMTAYRKKFGPQIDAMLPQMVATGKAEGILFSYGGKVGNTFNSHRLVAHARAQGKQDAMLEAIFHAYFEKEQDISDDKVLVGLAKQVGLEEAATAGFLAGPELRKEIQAELDSAARRGITGVPHFTIDGKLELNGAQPPEAFLEAFEELGVL